MKALSLQQPYAWLILQRAYEDNPQKPLKSIENRTWPLPSTFAVPQRIWIHASLSMYDVRLAELKEIMSASQWMRCKSYLYSTYSQYEAYHRDKKRLQPLGHFGCILGSIIVVGQVTHSESPWFVGPYGYVLEYPEMLSEPIPYKGRLRFFQPDITP